MGGLHIYMFWYFFRVYSPGSLIVTLSEQNPENDKHILTTKMFTSSHLLHVMQESVHQLHDDLQTFHIERRSTILYIPYFCWSLYHIIYHLLSPIVYTYLTIAARLNSSLQRLHRRSQNKRTKHLRGDATWFTALRDAPAMVRRPQRRVEMVVRWWWWFMVRWWWDCAKQTWCHCWLGGVNQPGDSKPPTPRCLPSITPIDHTAVAIMSKTLVFVGHANKNGITVWYLCSHDPGAKDQTYWGLVYTLTGRHVQQPAPLDWF